MPCITACVHCEDFCSWTVCYVCMCPVAGPRAIRIGPSVFKPDVVQDKATKPGFSFYAFGITVCLSLSVHTCFSCIGLYVSSVQQEVSERRFCLCQLGCKSFLHHS